MRRRARSQAAVGYVYHHGGIGEILVSEIKGHGATYMSSFAHLLNSIECRQEAHHDVSVACGSRSTDGRVDVGSSSGHSCVSDSATHIRSVLSDSPSSSMTKLNKCGTHPATLCMAPFELVPAVVINHIRQAPLNRAAIDMAFGLPVMCPSSPSTTIPIVSWLF